MSQLIDRLADLSSYDEASDIFQVYSGNLVN